MVTRARPEQQTHALDHPGLATARRTQSPVCPLWVARLTNVTNSGLQPVHLEAGTTLSGPRNTLHSQCPAIDIFDNHHTRHPHSRTTSQHLVLMVAERHSCRVPTADLDHYGLIILQHAQSPFHCSTRAARLPKSSNPSLQSIHPAARTTLLSPLPVRSGCPAMGIFDNLHTSHFQHRTGCTTICSLHVARRPNTTNPSLQSAHSRARTTRMNPCSPLCPRCLKTKVLDKTRTRYSQCCSPTIIRQHSGTVAVQRHSFPTPVDFKWELSM